MPSCGQGFQQKTTHMINMMSPHCLWASVQKMRQSNLTWNGNVNTMFPAQIHLLFILCWSATIGIHWVEFFPSVNTKCCCGDKIAKCNFWFVAPLYLVKINYIWISVCWSNRTCPLGSENQWAFAYSWLYTTEEHTEVHKHLCHGSQEKRIFKNAVGEHHPTKMKQCNRHIYLSSYLTI